MKRRTFIFSTLFVTATIPFINLLVNWDCNILLIPKELRCFCDDNTLREMGNRYLQKFPEENNKEKLNGILLTDFDGKKINPGDKPFILQLLQNKIYEEFSENQTIILGGWVISRTEGRQCALFSFT